MACYRDSFTLFINLAAYNTNLFACGSCIKFQYRNAAMSSVVYPVQSYTAGGWNTFHLHLTAFGLKWLGNDGLLIQKWYTNIRNWVFLILHCTHAAEICARIANIKLSRLTHFFHCISLNIDYQYIHIYTNKFHIQIADIWPSSHNLTFFCTASRFLEMY
jgi:hypothetical protein